MYEYSIKEIIKIVDGDTLDVLIDLGFGVTIKQRVRLYGIDAPESITSDGKEKKIGLESKEYLRNWLSEKEDLIIKTLKDDKYGRILAKITSRDNNSCVNDDMIKYGYAWLYKDKSEKKDFDHLIENRNLNSN